MYERTIGEICAGIGGFGLGFEQAGWRTAWQIELDDVNRTVLADRFPGALQYKDLRDWRSFHLSRVGCVAFGFPCQDISVMGNGARDKSRRGLAGDRSGLVFEILDIVGFLQPAWVVVENVPALLISNGGRDIQAIIGALRQLGYLGFGRVLDAQYFGVPQKRRRLFLAAGLGRYPAWDFLADAGPMESLPCARGPGDWAGPGDGWAAYTLTAPDKLRGCNSRTNLKSELLIAEADGWDSMAERGRAVELHGLSQGLDAPNAEAAYAAGNAVPPPHCKMAG